MKQYSKKNKLTVVCVLRTPPATINSKQKAFKFSDVYKLKKSFDRFLTIPHDFVCLTDSFDKKIPTIDLIGDTPNWWAKLELFRPNLFLGPVLYIDLDMVICDYIDDLVGALRNHSFVLLGDSKKGDWGSGIIYFEGDHSDLWSKYSSNPKSFQRKYSRKPRYGDQAFIEDNKNFVSLTEIKGIKKSWFHRLHFNSVPSSDSKILVCCGKGNKLHREEYNNHPWVKKYWREI